MPSLCNQKFRNIVGLKPHCHVWNSHDFHMANYPSLSVCLLLYMNLVYWSYLIESRFELCSSNSRIIKHDLSCFPIALKQGHLTYCHDSILNSLSWALSIKYFMLTCLIVVAWTEGAPPPPPPPYSLPKKKREYKQCSVIILYIYK